MSAAPRLALFYSAVFLLVGIQLPFWPVWLSGRGLGAGEIGLLLGAALWVKVVANPLAGMIADRSGRRRLVMIVLAAGNLGSFLLFLPAQGFWALLAINILATATFSTLLPLGENLALAIAYAHKIDYGRMRLWGSVSFILAALGAGRLIAGRTSEIVLTLAIGGAALNLLVCLILPRHPLAPGRAVSAAWRRLLLDRRQLLFLAAATLIQASHSIYYAFGTLHWRALGYSSEAIGWLWAEGVVAEVALFALSARLVARLGPPGLLVLAGLGGLLRWSLTAVATTLPALLLLQLLHALTFGAAHLGAMHFMARALPPELSATGQALYSATVAGIGFGLVIAGSGPLYAAHGGGAYFVMAALAAAGAGAAWLLGRIWRGERLFAAA